MWLGTLVLDKENGTGTHYRRNRVVDVTTGRFTQQDPVGLAGGMNLYGYANGDPINNSDPFGLCPEKLRDKDGNCPGGLSVREWDRVEYAARNRMAAEAQDRVIDLLFRGKISSVAGLTSRGRPALGVGFPLSDKVKIDAAAFSSLAIGDFAFLLAHEAAHTTQLFMRLSLREANADAFACANTWGRERFKSGAYRSTLGPCGSGLP